MGYYYNLPQKVDERNNGNSNPGPEQNTELGLLGTLSKWELLPFYYVLCHIGFMSVLSQEGGPSGSEGL